MRNRISRILKSVNESTLKTLNTPGYLAGFGRGR